MAYPTSLDNFTHKTDDVDTVFANDINELQDAIEALEVKTGITGVGFNPASAAASASVVLHEDTDNGTNKITVQAPASIASDKTITLPDATDTLVGKDTTDTLTNKTLTSPKIGTAIADTNGNEIIKTPATASAVNEVTITNAATGNAPQISATGDDSNIDLKLSGKGTGRVLVNGGLTVVTVVTEFTTASTSLVDITNWTTGATIVLKEASDVEIVFTPSYTRNSVGASGANQYQFKRDTTSIGSLFYSTVGASNQFISLSFVDQNVAAGTYTYKVQMQVASGTATVGAGQLSVKARSTGV